MHSLLASEGNKKDKTYNFIQEVIFAGKEELTRLDVELALLKELGPVSDMLVESMFDSMDEDESGTIDVDEMHHFIHDVGVKKVTCCNGRLCKAFQASFTDIAWLMNVIFFAASTIGFVNELKFKLKENGLWVDETFTPFFVYSYMFLVGTLVFAVQAFNREGEVFDTTEKGRTMLELFLQKRNATTGDANDGGDHSTQPTNNQNWEHFQDNMRGLDKIRFNQLLEESGVFISRFQLDPLFQEIDVDEVGTIYLKQLDTFVNMKKERNVSIWKNCLKSVDFISQSFWFLGSVAYIFVVHMTDNEAFLAFGKVSISWYGVCVIRQHFHYRKIGRPASIHLPVH